MANPNIFQQYLQPPRSMADYSAELDKTEANQLALTGQRQGVADANALRRATQSFGNDPTANLNALERAGLYKEASAYQKQILDSKKTQADTDLATAHAKDFGQKTDAGNFDLTVKKADKALTDIAALQDPASAHASIDAHLKAGDIDPAKAQMLHQGVPQDPAQFPAWQVQMLRGIMSAKDRMYMEAENARNAATNATHVKTTQMSNDTSIKTTGMNNATAMRGQDLTNSRTVEANGKAPAGYMWGKDDAGNTVQVAVPGGPADLKKQGALNQDTQALTGSISGFDRLAAAANEVLQHPGLKGITGIRGAFPNAPGTEAANAEALLGTLKSQVGFGVLQDMRNNSKTGGALGSVSDAEGKRLEANLAALEKSQSLDQYKANLKKIVDYAESAKDRVREAYNLKHGAGSANPGKSAPAATAATAKTVNFGDLK